MPFAFDESESLLAAHGVATHGLPIFPSGALFVHGTTLSYLLAPLVWLGWGEPDNLFILRAVSAILGSIAVYLTYRLARAVVGSTVPALLAAALVAFHPLSVQYGGFLRMYALEQVLAVAVVWLFVRQVVPEVSTTAPNGRRRELVGLVIAFWLAVFAHLSVALLWPAMAAVAVLLQGRTLLGPRRALSAALALCLPAPLVLIGASTMWQATGTAMSSSASPSTTGYIGAQHVDLGRILAPDLRDWAQLFRGGPLAEVMPALVVALSGVLIGRYLLAGSSGSERAQWRPIAASLLLYWVPVLTFAAVAVYANARYLLFLQPLGAVLVAAALAALAGRRPRATRSEQAPPWQRAAAVGLALLMLTDLGIGVLTTEVDAATRRPDPTTAYRYVAAHHAPGEPIFVRAPSAAYFVLGDRGELRFLVDAEWKLDRYTRPVGGERLTDMFVGIESIASVDELCGLLTANPGSWLVDDYPPKRSTEKLTSVDGALERVFKTTNGVRVFRSLPPAAWKGEVRKTCELPEDGTADRKERRAERRGAGATPVPDQRIAPTESELTGSGKVTQDGTADRKERRAERRGAGATPVPDQRIAPSESELTGSGKVTQDGTADRKERRAERRGAGATPVPDQRIAPTEEGEEDR
jgi:hypothetical protein